MGSTAYPINPQHTLPPLLACLATTSAAREAPPTLLPLLTPINQQRVRLLASQSDTSWLQLLSSRASSEQWARLLEIVSGDTFEPHPASGEIELGFVAAPQYQRIDEETMQVKVMAADLEITVVYLWCGDVEGASGRHADKWRVSEILPGTDGRVDEEGKWEETINQAEECYYTATKGDQKPTTHGASNQVSSSRDVKIPCQSTTCSNDGVDDQEGKEEDEDDSYWSQYDNIPSETPAKSPSPIPRSVEKQNHEASGDGVDPTEEEDTTYYGRYDDVQPALDNDDPPPAAEEEMLKPGSRSRTINHNVIEGATAFQNINTRPLISSGRGDGHGDERISSLDEPKPQSPTEASAIARLEGSADRQSIMEVRIRQHVENEVKNLYVLCKSMGMKRGEYADLVKGSIGKIEAKVEE